MAVSVVVTSQPSMTPACLSHLSDCVSVIWFPSDRESPHLQKRQTKPQFLKSVQHAPFLLFRGKICLINNVSESLGQFFLALLLYGFASLSLNRPKSNCGTVHLKYIVEFQPGKYLKLLPEVRTGPGTGFSASSWNIFCQMIVMTSSKI
jgi:hypothetical protein